MTKEVRARMALVRKIRASLKEGRYTSLGCYPKFYLTSDGGVLSHESVNDNWARIVRAIVRDEKDGWQIVGVDVNWEDADLYCDDTGERIPSAYAEDTVSA